MNRHQAAEMTARDEHIAAAIHRAMEPATIPAKKQPDVRWWSFGGYNVPLCARPFKDLPKLIVAKAKTIRR